jgi:hypothetical protein
MTSTQEIMADLLTFENQRAVHSIRNMKTFPPVSQIEWDLADAFPDLSPEQAEAISAAIWLMAEYVPTTYLVMAQRLEKFRQFKLNDTQQEEKEQSSLTQAIANKSAGNHWLNQ